MGDRLLSDEDRVKPSVSDLFFGNSVNLVDSFTSEAIILGVVNWVSLFIATLSNPWSMNGTSDPPALVPETVLMVPDTFDPSPGVIISNTGVILLNCIFLVPLTLDPPTWFSSVKLGTSSGFVTSPLSIWIWYLSISLSDFNKVLDGSVCVWLLILCKPIPFNSYGNIWVLTKCACWIESTPLEPIPNVPAGDTPAVIDE